MKEFFLKKVSERIKRLMQENGLSAKALSKKSKITYSSLMPILNGARECGISKLIAIAEALNCNPDSLLQGTYSLKQSSLENADGKPRYLAAFISIVKITYCRFYEIASGKISDFALPFALRCGDDTEAFLNHLAFTLEKINLEQHENITPKEVAIFASVQQYGRRANREKIIRKGEATFASFFLEQDSITNHEAFLGRQNGICVSINTGDMITYSADKGKSILSLQGYGFPISDVAGNYWIGCEAIKHAIAVKEQKESSTALSDRLLALYNDDVGLLCTKTMEDPYTHYLAASAITKELIKNQEKAFVIVQKSFELLFQDIKLIDKRTKKKMPIFLAGELAYLYEGFFPKERLIRTKEQQSLILLKYGLKKLHDLLKASPHAH